MRGHPGGRSDQERRGRGDKLDEEAGGITGLASFSVLT